VKTKFGIGDALGEVFVKLFRSIGLARGGQARDENELLYKSV
jgi:hypothetical protein